MNTHFQTPLNPLLLPVRWLVLVAGLLLATILPLPAAELRGRVTDAGTGRSLVEAAVTLTPSGPGAPVTRLTNLFGQYEFTGLPAGGFTLAATHPGYLPFSEPKTFTSAELAARDIPLTPTHPGDPSKARIDVLVQVFDTMTMQPLADVPVRVQRYESAGSSTPAESFLRTTDMTGRVALRSSLKGHYAFRFNHAGDGTARTSHEALDDGLRRNLQQSHSAVAQLLPVKQSVTVRVMGPDPRDPEGGPKRIADVDLEFTAIAPGPLPPGFDPATMDPRDFFPAVLPPAQGKTNADGEFVFGNLPPSGYLVTATRPGWKRSFSFFGPNPAGTLPAVHVVGLVFETRTRVEVVVTAPYTRPEMREGLPVRLEGIAGSATEGIEREAITMPMPPVGIKADFGMLVPGRYRISVDHFKASPPVPAREDGTAPFIARFRGEDYFEVPLATVTTRTLALAPEPATIRGRIFFAEERESLDLPVPEGVTAPLDRWHGPAYRAKAQTGIEFMESAVVDFLPPGMSVISVDAAADGTFTLRVLPGMWGVSIPSLDGWFGSNYASFNHATGESVAFGWPYAVNTLTEAIPRHPFGSKGMIVNSGDDLEIDFFVRKQTYYLDGQALSDDRSHALDRVVARAAPADLLVNHSHVAETSEVVFDENGAAAPAARAAVNLTHAWTTDLEGNRVPSAAAEFLVAAPRGTHRLTVRNRSETAHHTWPGPVDVTLPDYGYPGLGGLSLDDVIPLEKVWTKLHGVPDPYIPVLNAEGTVLIRFLGKDQNDAEVLRSTADRPHYVHHPGFGTRLFPISQGGAAPRFMAGTWTFFIQVQGVWYSQEVTIPGTAGVTTVNFKLASEWVTGAGPLGEPPNPACDMILRAVNADDPTQLVGGVTVDFADGSRQTTPSGTPFFLRDNSRQESFTVDRIVANSVTTRWTPPSGSLTAPDVETTVDMSPARPLITVTLKLRRGLRIDGRLKARSTGGSFTLTKALPDKIRVRLRSRFGTIIRDLMTAADGTFLTNPALTRQSAVFLEVDAPGFEPHRARLDFSTGTPNGTTLELSLGDIFLKPLPPPVMRRTPDTFDRRGSFLVGVRKGKDGAVTGDDPHVNMTHLLEADSPSTAESILLPDYDQPSGSRAVDLSVRLTDPVTTIWMVDPRSFPGNPTSGAAVDVSPPAEEQRPDGEPDNSSERIADPLYSLEVQKWLRDLAGKQPPIGPPIPGRRNVLFFNRAPVQEPLGDDRLRATTTGSFSLAALPPGLFQPWLVAVTSRGQVHMYQWKPLPTDPPSQALYGLATPKWLHGLTDVLGSVAAAQGDVTIGLEQVLQGGFIRLTPEFSGDITVNEDKTLKYAYSLGAEFEEGTTTPGTDLLSFFPGFCGLTVRGRLAFELNGSRPSLVVPYGEPALTLAASASGAVKTEKFLPSIIKRLGGKFKALRVGVGVKGGLALSSTEVFRPPHQVGGSLDPLQLSLESRASGALSLPVTFDFTSAAAVIPKVGWLISALGDAGRLKAEATVEPTAGAELTRRLTTRYASEAFGATDLGTPLSWVDPTHLGPRRCIIGEDFLPLSIEYVKQGALLLGMEASLELGLDAIVAATGAKGTIGVRELSSDPTVRPPTLSVELNRFGDWPPVRRISGEAFMKMEVFARLWLLRVSGKHEEKITIDRTFNTAAKLFVEPIDYTETTTSQSSTGPVEWCGAPPQLAVQHPDLAAFASALSGSAQAVAFLDPVAPGGLMRLRVAVSPTPGTWLAPVTIGTAAGVTGVALHALPSDGWMLAWSEIAAGSLTAFSPPTTLRYATSPTGAAWTAPATAATSPDTAHDLKFVPLPAAKLALLWAASARGAGAEVVDLRGAVFAAGAWTAPVTLLDEASLRCWEVAGRGFAAGGPAQIVHTTSTSALRALSWDGATPPPPVATLMPSGAAALCRTAAGPGGTFLAAVESTSGGLTFFKKGGPAAPWTPLALPARDLLAMPADLALAAVDGGPPGMPHWALTVTTGPATPDLVWGWFDFSGTWLRDPAVLEAGAPGRYAAPRIVARPGGADVFALYESGTTRELRTFAVAPTGVPPADRDGDTLQDLTELRIIDADSTDLLRKLTDVLPGADYDGDGFTNAAEATADTDPTDPASFPGQRVHLTATEPAAAELGLVPGLIHVVRSGDLRTALTVNLGAGGTATPGVDCETLPATVTFGIGTDAVSVPVFPLSDALAEGNETLTLTVLPGAGYTAGTPDAASVTLADLPLDSWRFTRFTPAELADPAIGGLKGDGERDSLSVLLEYAFDSDPQRSSLEDAPSGGIVIHPGTHARHLALAYLRRKNDAELVYVVQHSPGLNLWTDATAADMENIGLTDNGDGTETVTVRDRQPLDGPTPRRFLRLEVRRAGP